MFIEIDNCIFCGVEVNVIFKICISIWLFVIRGFSSRGFIVYIFIWSCYFVFCCNVFMGFMLICYGILGNSVVGFFCGGILFGVDFVLIVIMVSRKKYFFLICLFNGKWFYSIRIIRSKIILYIFNDVDISYNVYDL